MSSTVTRPTAPAVPRPDGQPPAQGTQPPPEGQQPPEDQGAPQTPAEGQGEPETFDRAYVERLRDEAGAARVRAKDRDALADRLVVALAAADGRLADPDDLPRSAELLTDPTPENVTAAVAALLQRKPHLASRRPTGDAGQGVRSDEQGVSLLGLLRGA